MTDDRTAPVTHDPAQGPPAPAAGDLAGSPPAPGTVRTRAALAVLLGLTAVTYLWNLDRNGWGNTFYAAAVQAGTKSWKAFFFGSFDAGNFITVDKPPVSLWVMELSGRVFGFGSWSMLVPEALLGVAAVALLYATVRRVWGAPAGLISAAGLAATPVAALMFRFDNPDAALTFLLVLAAWTLTRALDGGRLRWLLATGVVLGVAFLTKELQALLVLPGFALAYLLAGPPRLGVRIRQLLAAGGALAVSGLWWPVLVDSLPAGDRPYIGGSTTNSVLQLALGYNGIGRITGNEGGGRGRVPGDLPAALPGGGLPAGAAGGIPGGPAGGFGRGGPGGGGGFGGSTGIGRLFNPEFGGMAGWLIPAALVGLVAGLWLVRRAPRSDPRRGSLIAWGGWFLVTAGVLSFAGGIIHSYYTVALAPGVAALAGMVLPALWQRRDQWWARGALALSTAATTVTAVVLLDRASGWLPWLRWTVLAGGLVATVVLIATGGTPGRSRAAALRGRLAPAAAGLALTAGLAAPVAWSLATVNSTHTGGTPTAGPAQAARFGFGRGFADPGRTADGQTAGGQLPGAGLPGGGRLPGGDGSGGFVRPGGDGFGGGFGGGSAVPADLTALLRNAGTGYTWAAAAPSSMTAGPLELASGTSVMSLGGFGGSDPAITLDRFRADVAAHRVRYYVAGRFGGPGGGFGGGPGAASGRGQDGAGAIASWVESTFRSQTVGGATVYDLSAPLRSASSATSGSAATG